MVSFFGKVSSGVANALGMSSCESYLPLKIWNIHGVCHSVKMVLSYACRVQLYVV